jgi:hypothetical protein
MNGQVEEKDVAPSPRTTEADMKAVADGKYKRRKGHGNQLSGKLVGDPVFNAKTILQVEGIGRRLSGRWAVKSVHHVIDGNGYVCDFKAERDGDNGYGNKSDANSKANIAKPDAKDQPQLIRVWHNSGDKIGTRDATLTVDPTTTQVTKVQ